MSVCDWYSRCAGIALFAMPLVSLSNGSDFMGGGYKYTTGLVYKQGLIIEENSPTGQPEFAIYNRETGDFIEAVEYQGAEGEPYWIGNAEDYNASASGYNAFVASLPDEHRAATRVMSADEYTNDLQAGRYTKGSLLKGTRWVLAYDPELLDATVQLDSEDGLLLFQSRYDLNALAAEPEVGERSLLFNDSGQIKARSNNTIGYRVAYIKPDGSSDENERDRRYSEREDELIAPVTNAVASTAFDLNGGHATDENGRYMAYYYIPPCPGFTYQYTIPVSVAVPYRTYNPQKKSGSGQYLFWGLSDYTCIGPPIYPPLNLVSLSGYIDSLAEYASIYNTPSPVNFPIDVTLISGRFGLYNPASDNNSNSGSDGVAGTLVPVGDTTRRQSLPEPDPETSHYQMPEPKDYNGDDELDHVSELGALTDEYIEDVDDEQRKRLYGVWFSEPDDATRGEGGVLVNADGEPIKPDLVRVADLIPNFDNIGLLEQVSEQDLLETDLYVFRESTGELVVEKLNYARFGDLTETPKNGVDEQSSLGYFELTIPGQDAGNSFRNLYRDRSLYKDYEDWQASYGVQESLQGYKADSLRVGEPLTLVVINRATGYLGSASTSVLDVTDQSINIELPDIRLFPPNLQVQVDRQYQVDKGLTAGQTRNYRVGSEGCRTYLRSVRAHPHAVG